MTEAMVDIEQLLTEKDNYPNIPPQFWAYLKEADRQQVDDLWLKTLKETNLRAEILQDVDQRFKRACKILKCKPSDIAKAFDLEPNNVANNRLDSFFAELRGMFFLDNLSFSDIKPLHRASQPLADFEAKYGATRYAVEVFHSSSIYYRSPRDEERRHNLIQFFLGKAREKKKQIDNTRKEYGCQKGILLLVLDSCPSLIRDDKYSFEKVLKKICDELKWGKDYHFGIATGFVSLKAGPDDVLYPRINSGTDELHTNKSPETMEE
jgi:DNA-binding Xre family transcriptional regulator